MGNSTEVGTRDAESHRIASPALYQLSYSGPTKEATGLRRATLAGCFWGLMHEDKLKCRCQLCESEQLFLRCDACRCNRRLSCSCSRSIRRFSSLRYATLFNSVLFLDKQVSPTVLNHFIHTCHSVVLYLSCKPNKPSLLQVI